MEIDSEEQDDGDRVFKLEQASKTVDEAKTPVVPANTDEAFCNKFLSFAFHKVPL